MFINVSIAAKHFVLIYDKMKLYWRIIEHIEPMPDGFVYWLIDISQIPLESKDDLILCSGAFFGLN